MRYGLNLGCGCRPLPDGGGWEWSNLDKDPGSADHAALAGARFERHDLLDRLPYGDRSFHLVNMSQVFEHFQLHDAVLLACECRRVLKPGGTLRVSVPDAGLLVRKYLAGEMDEFAPAQPPVYAAAKSQMLKLGLILFGALHEHGEDAHKQCYDFGALAEVLAIAGFGRVEPAPFDPALDAPVAAGHQLAVTARKPLAGIGPGVTRFEEAAA